ncbi:hypothetical protein NJB1907E90_21870, partial [Mycobacterium marinum]
PWSENWPRRTTSTSTR